MGMKQEINLIVESAVAQGATDISLGTVIPNGETVRLLKFGGYERLLSSNTGIIALQIGSGGTWQTIRAGGGGTPFEFELNKNYVGDGVKRFRLVLQNKDPAGGPAKEMVAWIEAIVL
jgi:hypothetical protein